ncbi:MAG: hypothetical protein ACRD37_06670 [Candidatus Acidiferrales bacterium]
MDKDDIKPQDKNQDADGNDKQSKNAPPVTADVGKEDSKEQADTTDTNKKKRKLIPLTRFEIWTIILGSIAILVAAATGLAIYWKDKIASNTLSGLQEQTHTAAQELELSERPWVESNVVID